MCFNDENGTSNVLSNANATLAARPAGVNRKEDLSSLQRVATNAAITYGRIIQPGTDAAMRRVRIRRASLSSGAKINYLRFRELFHPSRGFMWLRTLARDKS